MFTFLDHHHHCHHHGHRHYDSQLIIAVIIMVINMAIIISIRAVDFLYMPDKMIEEARNVSINLHGEHGRLQKILILQCMDGYHCQTNAGL